MSKGISSAWAFYPYFVVENAANKYRLNVAAYSGTAGDSLSFQNNMKWSAYDQDNDGDSLRNCADLFEGPNWHNNCI